MFQNLPPMKGLRYLWVQPMLVLLRIW